ARLFHPVLHAPHVTDHSACVDRRPHGRRDRGPVERSRLIHGLRRQLAALQSAARRPWPLLVLGGRGAVLPHLAGRGAICAATLASGDHYWANRGGRALPLRLFEVAAIVRQSTISR